MTLQQLRYVAMVAEKGTIPERSARSLDESSACTEVCVNGFRHSVQADLSRHTGCFPCAKFELVEESYQKLLNYKQ